MAAGKAKTKATKDGKRTKKASGDGEVPVRAKGSTLVVVESPAKAKTIKKYLGSGYVVKASVGHVMDLPKSKIGVDIENGFEPVYEVIEAKKKVVAELKAGRPDTLPDDRRAGCEGVRGAGGPRDPCRDRWHRLGSGIC